jgi:catechol 2,3-dioxygenase-like lactoylglutathione lyase family enzyme
MFFFASLRLCARLPFRSSIKKGFVMEFQFDHAAQVVPDIAEAVAWYQATLPGVQVLHQDESWAFLDAGGVRLAFVKRDQHPNHLAWRVSAEDLERLAAQHGQEIKTHRDNTRSFYLEAPGGQWIEIIHWPEAAL